MEMEKKKEGKEGDSERKGKVLKSAINEKKKDDMRILKG